MPFSDWYGPEISTLYDGSRRSWSAPCSSMACPSASERKSQSGNPGLTAISEHYVGSAPMRRYEPNLRQLDPRLGGLQRQAGSRAGKWRVRDNKVLASDGQIIATCPDAETAAYLRDLHTHFLPILNQLHYFLRSSADLEKGKS
jgi:hypothetical protein